MSYSFLLMYIKVNNKKNYKKKQKKMQAVINFYSEKIKTEIPKNFEALKQLISQHLMIPQSDVNEMIITSQIDEHTQKEIKSEFDFQRAFFGKPKIEVDVKINENSKLFQQEEKNLLDKCKDKIQGFDFNIIVNQIQDIYKKAGVIKTKIVNGLQDTINNVKANLPIPVIPVPKNPVNEPKKPVPQNPVNQPKKPVPQKPVHVPRDPFPNEPSFKNGKPVHKEYICDGCEQVGIVGIRYQCTVCKDFDYCEECEKKYGEKHGHPLLKIRRPEFGVESIHCIYPNINA